MELLPKTNILKIKRSIFFPYNLFFFSLSLSISSLLTLWILPVLDFLALETQLPVPAMKLIAAVEDHLRPYRDIRSLMLRLLLSCSLNVDMHKIINSNINNSSSSTCGHLSTLVIILAS